MHETLVYTCDFINSAYKLLGGMPVPFAVLLSAVLATSGWIYTSWLGRVLAKKQHTMTILVKGNFCEELNKAHEKIQQPLLDYRKDKTIDEETFNEILPELNRVLNNYEFIAAGIRLGYLDEKLVKNAERRRVLLTYEICKEPINKLRDTDRKESMYEHIQWLYNKWQSKFS